MGRNIPEPSSVPELISPLPSERLARPAGLSRRPHHGYRIQPESAAPMPTFESRLLVGLHNRPLVLLTLTALFWGGNAVAGAAGGRRSIAHDVDRPALAPCLRHIPAHGRRRIAARHGRSCGRGFLSLIVMGLLGFTGFNALFYIAAYYTEATNIGIIQDRSRFSCWPER